MRTTALVFGMLVAALAADALAQGDPVRGATLTSNCTGCHTIPGWRNASPPYRVPKIGGQHPEYIVAALQAYKNKERDHPTMHAIASTLSEQDMQDLAAYFAGEKPREGAQ